VRPDDCARPLDRYPPAAEAGPLLFADATPSGGDDVIAGPGALPLNTWSHVAVTLSGTTGTLYVNGQPVATNNNMTVTPAALGNTTQNWIGQLAGSHPLGTVRHRRR
jgi:hypothetical protein